jgi:hypothetical protein
MHGSCEVLCQLGHCPKEKAASRQSRSKALLANMVAGGCGPDFWEMDLPQGGLLVIGSEGVDYFRDRESYDRDAGYHPDDSLMFANATAHVRAVASNVQQIVGNSGGEE